MSISSNSWYTVETIGYLYCYADGNTKKDIEIKTSTDSSYRGYFRVGNQSWGFAGMLFVCPSVQVKGSCSFLPLVKE